ncbi:heavy metal translocating P-type ATPase [Ruania albidiflava]|uniref:heavy metal translocating P-type ATPase n=1 Tax=Ruania albidiflava TaxID=366586 RepID=UPI0023F41F30|nr:heavy metal translocating P-type ATPase [Ruania albidiflava]
MWTLVRRYPLVVTTVVAGLVVLFLALLGLPVAAQVTATIYVGAIAGWTAIGMVRDILRGHWGLDVLAVVAMVATLTVGEYAAALIVALMLTGGEALEDYAALRARRELTALLDRAPEVAHLLARGTPTPGTDQTNETSAVEDIPAEEVRIDDVLLVRPGEIVPVDGTLLTEQASFDESSLTGESLPVTREAGAEVLSGAVNGERAVRVRALRRSADSQYQRILTLVREAEEAKAPIVRLADRYAVPFTVFALLLGGVAWAVSGTPVRFAEVLVLATPCPLLIAAPVAFLGGMSRTAKSGVIVKGGTVLETLARARSAAFDKTGTLTRGRPELVAVHPAPGIEPDRLLTLAASAEQYSSHVFAAAILTAAQDRHLPLTAGTAAREQATHGVQADIDGQTVRVGKLAFIREVDPAAAPLEVSAGQAVAYVSVAGRYAGGLALADAPRQEAPAVVAWLHQHGVDTTVMLTGDARATAEAISAAVGTRRVHAELLPEDKVRLVRGLEPKPVIMVGDGVNDAPVLASADVGIAMGARGATAAGQAADAVILRDDLSGVVDTLRISRHTVQVALTAIWIGIVLSVGLMLIATTGVIPAVVGALTQELVDLATILYALRARSAPRRD